MADQINGAPAEESGLPVSAEAGTQPQGSGTPPADASQNPEPPKKNTLGSFFGHIARPTGKAAENAASATINLGADILARVGYKHIDPDFALWYDNLKPAERNPLQFGKWAEEAFGEKPKGMAGVAEDLVQVAEGFFAVSKFLKVPSLLAGSAALGRAGAAARGFLGVEGVGGTAAKIGSAALKLKGAGFVVDAGMMDPVETNLLGTVDKSPSSVQSAVTRALAADEDAPETWNRLKVGLQGVLVGAALEKVVGATRAVYLWRKAKKLPLGSPERAELEGRIKALLHRSEKAPANAAVAEAPAPAPAVAPAAPVEKQLREAIPTPGTRPNTAAQNFSTELDQKLGIGLTPDGEINDIAFRGQDGKGGVRLVVSLDGGNVATVKTVESLEGASRSGKATQAMRALIETADKHGITLRLNASPFGEKALTREQLRDFYRKFGFEQVKDGEGLMVRRPGDAPVAFREAAPAAAEGKATVKAEFDVVRGEDGKWRFQRNGKVVDGSPEFVSAGEANTAAASVNDFIPAATTELTNLTKHIKDRILSGADPKDVAGLIDGTTFNFHWVSSADNAKAWINAVAEAASEAHTTAKQSMEETAALAKEMFGGNTPQETLSIASEVLGSVENLPAKIMGLRAFQHATAKYVAELSEKIDLAGMSSNGVDAEKLRAALGTLFEINPAVKRIGTRVGQSLNAFKGEAPMPGIQYVDAAEAAKQVPLGPEAAKAAGKAAGPRAPASAGIFANMTKREILNLARNIRLTGGDPAVVDHYLKNVLGIKPPAQDSPAWAMFQSIRYNSLLSGTLTHSKNIVSNLGIYLLRNAELASQGIQTGNKEMFLQGVDQLSALWLDAAESFSTAMKAAKSGTALLDQEVGKEGVQELLDAFKSGTETTGPKAWLKSLWNAPQTFLMSEDEFFKQLNYRGSVRAQALAEARRIGLHPDKWAEYVKNTMDGAFTPSGGAVNTTALDLARENTFQTPLTGLANDASHLIGKSKFLSFFFPFRKTPINVFLAAAERTPGLWRMSTRMREELSGVHGAQKAAEALSKIEMGQNLWLFATGLAAAGHISGGGPRDKQARRQLESTGWIPYGVKIPGTEKWVSFRAVEPFSTIFGIAADAADAVNDLSREARKKDFEELAGAFLLGTAANVYNKSFLKGLSDLSDILSGENSAGQRIIAGLGQQLVPFGGFLSQTANLDDVQRDAHTVRERVLSRIPYFSEGVEPVRTVLGKPLMKQSWIERSFWPLTISEEGGTKEQALMKDLLDGLGDGVQIPMPSPNLYKGLVNLQDRAAFPRPDGKQQSPYDRMLELYGTGVGDLPPVEQALRAVVDEDHGKLADIFGPSGYKYGYWKSAKPIDGIDVSENDTRLGIVRGVLAEYKDAAWEQVLKEYPSLAKKVKALDGEKKDSRSSQSANRMDAFAKFSESALP